MTTKQAIRRIESTINRWRESGRLHRFERVSPEAVFELVLLRTDRQRIAESHIEDALRELRREPDPEATNA